MSGSIERNVYGVGVSMLDFVCARYKSLTPQQFAMIPQMFGRAAGASDVMRGLTTFKMGSNGEVRFEYKDEKGTDMMAILDPKGNFKKGLPLTKGGDPDRR